MRIIDACTAIFLLAACGGSSDTGRESSDGGGTASGPDAADGDEPSGCGPWNCDGCCDGDTCQPGDDDDACGAGGAACQACGRWGECGDASICELAAASRWSVIASAGTLSATNHGGGGWDGDGDLPDVYLRATLADPASGQVRSERTDAHETLTPSWDQTLFSDVTAAALEGMQLEIYDEDGNADDSAGICTAAVRLEDAAAGMLEVSCPRSLASGTSDAPARAGWSVLLRLEPRSDGRPDAPALDRHALPALASAPGSCDITRTRDGADEAVTAYDEWGREVRRDQTGDDSFVWDCSGEDHCEVAGALPLVRRMEQGPFGWRIHVEDGDLDSRAVSLYDSLGRLVAIDSYDQDGRREWRTLYSYTAMRKLEHILTLGDDHETETTEFDERGSPIEIASDDLVEKLDADGDGLPIRYRVTDSSISETPVGTTWEVSYDGAGCAAALAAEVTNGALR
jgi:hypothetical protein